MKKPIIEILEHLSVYYRETLSPVQILMYAEDLSDLTPEQLIHAVKVYRKNPENRFFPLPSQLLAIVNPVNTDLDDGRDIASRVIAAVGSCGSYNVEGAKNYIGEIGWECVKRMGGWRTLCGEMTEDNKGIYQAQIRDLAMTLKKKSMNGTLASPQDFPAMLPDGSIKKLITGAIEKK